MRTCFCRRLRSPPALKLELRAALIRVCLESSLEESVVALVTGSEAAFGPGGFYHGEWRWSREAGVALDSAPTEPSTLCRRLPYRIHKRPLAPAVQSL